MAEDDSIELLTRQRYHGFQDRLRSQPRHLPYFGALCVNRTHCLRVTNPLHRQQCLKGYILIWFLSTSYSWALSLYAT
jgi:hypothetical protein